MSYIYKFLGTILDAIYKVVPNFGWSIVVFTILIRLILLPLMYKQQKSMVNMQKIQPELSKIQKKYANDKEKLNEETMKIYQENKVNPAGGCLPLIIQMPILLGVYRIIQQPITYLLKLNVPAGVIEALKQNAADTELNIVAFVTNNMPAATAALQKANLSYDLSKLKVNFDFLGLNLGYAPNACNGNYFLFIIPILSIVTSFLVSKFSQMGQPKSADPKQNEQQNQMKAMMYVFPFMTGYFCYVLPAAMGLYWIVGNILQMIQTYAMNKIMYKKIPEDDMALGEEDKKSKKKKLK